MKKYAYLDIETNAAHAITVIGVYRPDADPRCRQWIAPNLSAGELRVYLAGIETLFTYNGARFDLPIINDQLKVDLISEFTHRDLMHDCWKKKLFGGLKKVEKLLGIHRDTEGVNGWAAIGLWEKFRQQEDAEALETLLKYNREDVENLESLARRLGIIRSEEPPTQLVFGAVV